MACELVIKADNGKPSELFKSIAETTENPQEAVDLYFYTKSDEFRQIYGDYTSPDYNGPALDKNGEPVFSTISKEAFQYDAAYMQVDLLNRASVYKELLKRVPQIQKTIQDRIKKLQGGKYKNETMDKLEALEKVLGSGSINDSIPKFLVMASTHVNYLKGEMEKLMKEKEINIKRFAGIYKAAKTYEVIKELRLELLGSDLDNAFSEDILPIGETLAKVREIESFYISKSKDYLAKELHARNKAWTVAKIREVLDTAPRDLRFDEQLMEYAGDSADPIIAMVAGVMMEAEHKIRRDSIEFNKKLQPLMEKLEKKYPGNPYDKIIHQKSNGELHILNIDVEHTGGKNKDLDAEYAKITAIKNDPDLYEFLVFFTTEYQKMQEMLGHAAPSMGTRIPSVLKSDWERLQGKSVKERVDMMTDTVKKSIVSSNMDVDRGNLDDNNQSVRSIPVLYTKRYDSIEYNKFYEKFLEEQKSQGVPELTAINKAHELAEKEATKNTAAFISQDLGHTLQMFHNMALNFSAKHELLPIFESAEAVVGSDFRQYTLVDSGGKPAVNRLSGLIDTKSGVDSTAKKVLTKFLDMHLYDQKELDLGFTTIGDVKIDNAKALRKIGAYTSFTQLSLNILASINNVGTGEYNNVMEAVGGEHYTVKDYHKASGFYKSNLPGILSDIGERTPNNIVNLLEEHYDMLQDFRQDLKSSEKGKFKRLMGTDILFFMSNAGEHLLQLRGGLALLENTKAYDKDGNQLGSLLSLHKAENGKLIIPDVYVKDQDGSLTKYDTTQQNRVSNKIGAVLRFSHGNYSPQKAIAAAQDARLSLVLQFRKWLYPGYVKRLGRPTYNLMLESDNEGYYKTGARVTTKFIKALAKLKLDVAKEDWSKLTPKEKANMRKFIFEASILSALFAASMMLTHAGSDDDSDDSDKSFGGRMIAGAKLLPVYLVNRMYTEIFAYINPAEGIKLMRTPAASLSILENIVKALGQLTAPFEEYETGWRTGDNKLVTKVGKLVPGYKQIESLTDDGIKEKIKFY